MIGPGSDAHGSPRAASPRACGEGGGSGPAFDLVVTGGTLVDPGAGRHGRFDLAIANGMVQKVAPAIPATSARRQIDARGKLVLPGLIDLHTHLFAGGSFWGIDPRPVAWRSGVTTWIDAGSAGAYNLAAFHLLLERFSPLRTWAFLNIAPSGLVAETGEARDPLRCDPGLCAAAIAAEQGRLVGVKCRLDRNAAGDAALEVLDRSLAAGEAAGVPVMVHIGAGPPRIDEVLDRLRPGDVVTHCTTGQTMALVDAQGRLRPSAARARARKVRFDVGHGSGAFSFEVARALVREGFWPDIISSDLHQRSVIGPAFDLPTTMAKLLALGMPLEAVVEAATATPARVIGLQNEVGTLEVGRRGDFALYEVLEGSFTLVDTHMVPLSAERLLANTATFVEGVELEASSPVMPQRWIELTEAQRGLLASPRATMRRPWAIELHEPSSFVPLALEPRRS